jgi:hypothetical protein
VVEGWLDLAKLVASEGSKAKSPYEELAFNIGACRAAVLPARRGVRAGRGGGGRGAAVHNAPRPLHARTPVCDATDQNAQGVTCMWTLRAGTSSCAT